MMSRAVRSSTFFVTFRDLLSSSCGGKLDRSESKCQERPKGNQRNGTSDIATAKYMVVSSAVFVSLLSARLKPPNKHGRMRPGGGRHVGTDPRERPAMDGEEKSGIACEHLEG